MRWAEQVPEGCRLSQGGVVSLFWWLLPFSGERTFKLCLPLCPREVQATWFYLVLPQVGLLHNPERWGLARHFFPGQILWNAICVDQIVPVQNISFTISFNLHTPSLVSPPDMMSSTCRLRFISSTSEGYFSRRLPSAGEMLLLTRTVIGQDQRVPECI